MTESVHIELAPKVDPLTLWRMDEKGFSDWRKKHDYPRIVSFLKRKLPEFEIWMEDQKVVNDLLIEYSPSTFLKKQSCIYLCKILQSDKQEIDIISSVKYAVGELIGQDIVKERKDIIPYPTWYRRKTKSLSPDLFVNWTSGRSLRILSELELLDLGNCELVNSYILGRRNLDFVNIDNLNLINCINNSEIRLWFSSAINVTIEGNFTFVDAYNTSFSQSFSQNQNLKLSNGTFQSWSFFNCRVNLSANNANLHFWEFSGSDFTATISNTDIRDCQFESLPVRYPIDYGRVKNFHAHVKRLYSQIGKRKEASQHYYLEKTYERKSFLHVRANYQNRYYRNRSEGAKALINVMFFFKYLYSGFLNILWGYGERPGRVFVISVATILIFAFGYCCLPNNSPETHYNFVNALYYSIVTFTTLGYGDIRQTNEVLRLMSAFEALLGMTFWGTLIAGFTSNAKDY